MVFAAGTIRLIAVRLSEQDSGEVLLGVWIQVRSLDYQKTTPVYHNGVAPVNGDLTVITCPLGPVARRLALPHLVLANLHRPPDLGLREDISNHQERDCFVGRVKSKISGKSRGVGS